MKILYLVHRIPYPPNKGDKIRSYHWLEALRRRHEVHLVTLCDDPDDLRYVPEVEQLCSSVTVVPLRAGTARARALFSLAGGRPLSVSYFRHRSVVAAVARLLALHDFDVVLCFSSAMAEYVRAIDGVPRVMDMVDVDSQKFADYSRMGRWHSRKLYSIEADRLARYEEEVARTFDAVVLCTEPESDLLRVRCPDARIDTIRNGVVVPEIALTRTPRDEPELLFVGAMDYHANVDAVVFAAHEILPRVRDRHPRCTFHVVGRSPTPAVRALAELPGVSVHANPPEVAGYLARAMISLVPLRVAQGIQNKVLEAMAWRLPVVTTSKVARSLDAEGGEHLLVAEGAVEHAEVICRLLESRVLRQRLAEQGRRMVEERFAWEPSYEQLNTLVESCAARPRAPVGAG